MDFDEYQGLLRKVRRPSAAALAGFFFFLLAPAFLYGGTYDAFAGDSEARLDELIPPGNTSVYANEDVKRWAHETDPNGPEGFLVRPAQEHLADMEQHDNFGLIVLAVAAPLALACLATAAVYNHRASSLRKRFEAELREDAERRAGDPSFTRRVTELTSSLEHSQQLIGELSAEVQARKQLLEQLSQDAKENKSLAELNAEAATAVNNVFARQLDSMNADIARRQKRDFWKNVAIGGVIVGLLTEATFDWVKPLLGMGP